MEGPFFLFCLFKIPYYVGFLIFVFSESQANMLILALVSAHVDAGHFRSL